MKGIIKLQQGGGIKVARVITDRELGNVPINIQMPSIDISSVFKGSSPVKSMPRTITVDKPKKKMTDTPPVGFTSDVKYAMNMVNSAKQKLTELAMEGKQGSREWASATNQLNSGLIMWKNTKNIQSDFNKIVKQNKLDSSALAVFNGKGVVQDLSTGDIKIVNEDDMLSTSVGGRLRYKPLSISDALFYRKNSPKFSGYTPEGQELTNILINAPTDGFIDKELKSAFKSSGFKSGSNTTLYTPDGKVADAATIIHFIRGDNVSEATLGREKYKTNSDALRYMRSYFIGKYESDPKLRSAMRSRAISQLLYTDPSFLKKDAKGKEAAINARVNIMINNSIASNLKTSYGESLKTKLAQDSKVILTDNDIASTEQGDMEPIDVIGNEYKIFDVPVTARITQVVDAPDIFGLKINKKSGLSLNNSKGIQKLSAVPVARGAVTFTGDKVLDVAGGDLNNVVVDPAGGLSILHSMPVISKDGSIIIDSDFIKLKADLENKKKLLVEYAYKSAETQGTPKEDYMVNPDGPETFGNLKVSKQDRIVQEVKKTKEYEDLVDHVKTFRPIYRDLVKFNVLINVRNGVIPWLTASGDDDKYIDIAGKREYYAERDDSAFESKLVKGVDEFPTGAAHNVYETAAYVPLASNSYTNSLFKPRSMTKEQVKRDLRAANENNGTIIKIDSLIK